MVPSGIHTSSHVRYVHLFAFAMSVFVSDSDITKLCPTQDVLSVLYAQRNQKQLTKHDRGHSCDIIYQTFINVPAVLSNALTTISRITEDHCFI